MAALRVLFLLTIGGGMALVFTRSPWEGHLRVGSHTWILRLPPAPLWASPTVPPYRQFRETFEELPPSNTPGQEIRPVLKWDWMVLELLLYLWVTCGAFGLCYVLVRGRQRDPILHGGLGVGIGLTAGAAGCFLLWLALGGWGPPLPILFGMGGLSAGALGAIASFRGND